MIVEFKFESDCGVAWGVPGACCLISRRTVSAGLRELDVDATDTVESLLRFWGANQWVYA
jgi:hypothetical protein